MTTTLTQNRFTSDDLFDFSENDFNGTGVIHLDVLQNDGGGNGRKIHSILEAGELTANLTESDRGDGWVTIPSGNEVRINGDHIDFRFAPGSHQLAPSATMSTVCKRVSSCMTNSHMQ